MTEMDAPLWTHTVRFDDAFRGLDLTLTADEAQRAKLKDNFGMTDLHALTARVRTTGKPSPAGDRVIVDVALTADVTQQCGVSLEDFRHEISAEIDVACVLKDKSRDGAEAEQELSLDDLDVPDIAENGQIDLGQYVIEALGEAYDPFARKPGVVYEEPDLPKEPSPFAALAKLKRDE
ncbi:YceD family protein [Asticcacaulis sp. BYS171W]|uniref:YceD family protein n=1 Tax=Asticcacaulis aquaticus TaxID=2984212 RepID=A0ABT5HP90_9CAUL|nr:YceD family protein [Asticcacaulis aquaticus]MDC7681885.1 YceD family protein [Asticcacaulis aquaticus]